MKKMNPAKTLCEFTLAQYPTVKKCMNIYKKYVESMCFSGGNDIKVSGGSKTPAEEKILNAQTKDPVISACMDFLNIVEDAVGSLSEEEQSMIREKFFTDYGRRPHAEIESDYLPRETFRRHYDKAIHKIERDLVNAWTIWNAEIKDAI